MGNTILKSSLGTLVKEYALVTLGVVSYALGWSIFLLPNNLIGGGVSGFASILFYATGLPMGVTYFILNVLLLVIGTKILGTGFGGKTIYAIVMTSVMLSIMPKIVDTSSLTHQFGDENPDKFSYLPFLSTAQNGTPQMPCFVVHTNEKVHETLRSGFADSPLFSGLITGIGPRYCPSIEDKLRTFAGKTEHQLFLEPEGRGTNEYYLQGFSSSLPLDVQMEALHQIKGLENAKVFRPAYAVEYDYFDPTQLKATLEFKNIENLFFAGQINGTVLIWST